MKFSIRHRTVYRYTEPVRRGVHELRLVPRSGPWQAVRHWKVSAPGNLSEARDGFGNIVHHFTLAQPADHIAIAASGEVEAIPHDPTQAGIFCDAPAAREVRVSPLYYLGSTSLTEPSLAMWAFIEPHAHGVRTGTEQGGRLREALVGLAGAVAERVRYRPNTTNVGTSAAHAFDLGSGVCQDQAHVMVACCRALGMPARYVSGYFYDPGATSLASHAWVDVCVDAARQLWCSIDVTHRGLTGLGHVRLAVGRDYRCAAPVRGVLEGGAGETLDVDIEIVPLA